MRCILTLATICLLLAAGVCSCRGSSALIEVDDTQPGTVTGPRDWLAPAGGPSRSGAFNWAGPANADLTWAADWTPEISLIAVGPDGTIYARDDDGLAVFTDRLEPVRRYETGTIMGESFTIGEDGSVRFGDLAGRIYCLSPDGTALPIIETWEDPTHCWFDSAGRPYISYRNLDLDEQVIIAYETDGTERWRRSLEYPYGSALRVTCRENRVFAQNGDDLYRLNEDGTIDWKFEYDYSYLSWIVFTEDGYSYVRYLDYDSSPDDGLLLLDPRGQVVWNRVCEDRCSGDPYRDNLTGDDGELYLTHYGLLTRYDLDGTSHVLLGEGYIDIAHLDPDGYIHMVNRNYPSDYALVTPDGQYRQYPDLIWSQGNAIHIGPEGRIYQQDSHGRITAHDLGASAEVAWEISPETAEPLGMTVSADDVTTVISKSRLMQFDSNGEWIADHPLPDDLIEDYPLEYAGRFRNHDLHLVDAGALLYAIDSNAETVWFHDLGSHTLDTCLPAGDRVLISFGPNLAMLDHNGDELFRYRHPPGVSLRRACLDDTGWIYAASWDFEPVLAALTPAGELSWEVPLDMSLPRNILATNQGTILIQSTDKLLCYSNTGNLLWEHHADLQGDSLLFFSPMAVTADGLIYLAQGVSSHGGTSLDQHAVCDTGGLELLILNPTGTPLHTVSGIGYRVENPLVDSRGVLYFLNNDDELVSVSPSGEVSWQADVGDYASGAVLSPYHWAPSPRGGFIFTGMHGVFCLGHQGS